MKDKGFRVGKRTQRERNLTLREVQMLTLLSILSTTGARPSEMVRSRQLGYKGLKWQDVHFHATGTKPTMQILLRRRKGSKRLSRPRECLEEDIADAVMDYRLTPTHENLKQRGLASAYTWLLVYAWARDALTFTFPTSSLCECLRWPSDPSIGNMRIKAEKMASFVFCAGAQSRGFLTSAPLPRDVFYAFADMCQLPRLGVTPRSP